MHSLHIFIHSEISILIYTQTYTKFSQLGATASSGTLDTGNIWKGFYKSPSTGVATQRCSDISLCKHALRLQAPNLCKATVPENQHLPKYQRCLHLTVPELQLQQQGDALWSNCCRSFSSSTDNTQWWVTWSWHNSTACSRLGIELHLKSIKPVFTGRHGSP